jgi:hypothetical protein
LGGRKLPPAFKKVIMTHTEEAIKWANLYRDDIRTNASRIMKHIDQCETCQNEFTPTEINALRILAEGPVVPNKEKTQND